MKQSYQTSNEKNVKENTRSLDKVIDQENDIDMKNDYKRSPTILDFGDVYFVDAIIHQMGYDKVIDQINYDHKDTLYAMIAYYMLCNSSNHNASIWYEGSFASLLYPKAKLTSKNISNLLRSIGHDENRIQYFINHMNFIKENISHNKAVILEGTDLPNNSHMPVSTISTHDDQVVSDARMITAIQNNTDYPLMFRLILDDDIHVDTMMRSAAILEQIGGIDIDFILDDHLINDIDEFYSEHIDFLMNLPKEHSLYQNLIKTYGSDLKCEENMVRYHDQIIYIKKIEVAIEGHTAYAFLGYDLLRGNDEMSKILSQAMELTPAQIQSKLENIGYFALISSLPLETDNILPTYHKRHLVDQYFDLDKRSSKHVHSHEVNEDILRGHLLLLMIVATIKVYMQKKIQNNTIDLSRLFMILRNQKCIVNKTVTICEPSLKAKDLYKAFNIVSPTSFNKSDSKR